MLGIYKIENLINGKIYIGQSSNLTNRIKRHKSNSLKKNYRESNKPLYRAIRKYGIDNFSFEIIHHCEYKESLNKLELYYINRYSSNIPKYGYNLSLLGSHSTFVKLDNDILLNIIRDLKGELTKREIINKYDISSQLLNAINRGDVNRLSNEEYPIRLKKDSTLRVGFVKKVGVKCPVCGSLTKNKVYCSLSCSHETQKKVKNRPSVETLINLLQTKTLVELGELYGVSDNTIRKWIKNNKILRQ